MLLINPKRKDVGPSFSASPLKKKKKALDEADEEDGWDLQCTQVDAFDDMGATQVDFLDEVDIEKEEEPAFRLSAFGDDDIVSFIEEKEIACKWSSDPFCVGRIKFLQMPDEHKNRISRKHFEIHCCLNLDTNTKEFWLVDFSANGTMVDGEVGYSGKKTLLEDGSAIGILLTPAKDRVLFGFSFSIGGKEPSEHTNKFKLPKLNTVTQKMDAKLKLTTTTTTKQSKEDKLKTLKDNTSKINGVKLNGTSTNVGKDSGEKENVKKANGVFAMPAPKARTIPTPPTKSKSGFLQGLRFSLVGYDETALSDPKKKKLIQDLCDQGAKHVLEPDAKNVDVVVLNRNYFKDPENYNINLPELTSTSHIRFTGNTRYLEECLRQQTKADWRGHEILPLDSGGVVVLDSQGALKGKASRGIEPHMVGQLASMLREEKKAGAKWKVVASLSTISACAGMLGGLDGVIEVLNGGQKGENGEMDYMMGICETHASGYRHTLLLVNKRDAMKVQKIEKVVSVVDSTGFSSFAQNLKKNRKKEEK